MTPEVPTITLNEALRNRRLLNTIKEPRRMVSVRTVEDPEDLLNGKVISAECFRTMFPQFVHLAGYVESDDFQYLSLQVDTFILQIMRWI